MKEIIRAAVVEHLLEFFESRFGIHPDRVDVEKTTSENFGDYTTNAALVHSKRLSRKPRELADEIRDFLSEREEGRRFSRIEVAGPGFVNLYLSREFVWELVDSILSGGDYLSIEKKEGPRFLVEFVSANPTGPLHVGHGRGAAFGDALCRLLEFAGYPVDSEYYINDAGNQMKVLGKSLYIRYLQMLGEDIELPDDHYRGEYLIDIAREIVEERGGEFMPYDERHLDFFVKYAGDRILGDIRKDLEDFNVTFDRWFSERELHEKGGVDRAISVLKEKGYIYEKDGALWFKSTDFGDDKDRVVVKSDGEKTYFAADIAYHLDKFRRGYQSIVDVWGADHHGYVKRLASAIEALGYSPDQFRVILVQFVTLMKGGKAVSMSTRAGEFETLRQVLDEVGADAARFFYLMRSAHSHLEFDLDLAKETSSENPVYYVQYAHARICSLFREARERGIEVPEVLSVKGLEGDEEIAILKKVLEFRDVVIESASSLEPHRIPFYLIELARMFHSYYNRHRILTDDLESSLKKLALARAVGEVVRTGLGIIGVTAPEKM